ncbi:hypothetical protein Tco_0680695 [Tanacetum coccineum]|uniref:Uncharacterized protein n=1 Tax=Tanacetum coccineum TaxID=301880 RepID=A0ABQ4XM47_9ASTR
MGTPTLVCMRCSSTGRPLGAYNLGVATPRALVYVGLMTSGDARSWYMINGDAKSWVMSTTNYVDSETITHANGAQNSRLEEAPSKGEESQPLGSRVPLMSEEFEASEPSGTRTISSHSSASLDSTASLSPGHLLTQASPTPTPT